MATRSKKVSVSKAELQETAVAAAVVAEDKVEEGLIEISAGTQDLVAARTARRAGRAALASGVSNVTHGVDQMIVADKLAKLSEVVADRWRGGCGTRRRGIGLIGRYRGAERARRDAERQRHRSCDGARRSLRAVGGRQRPRGS